MKSKIKKLIQTYGLGSIRSLSIVASLAYFSLSLILLISFIMPQTADAAIPKKINFQGKITKTSDGTNVSDGTYAFRFKLYDDPTAGSLLWTEAWDNSSGPCPKLQVTNGVFNAKLGSCNSLSAVDFSGGAIYMSVDFAPTGTSYDGEMSPRKQMLSSAFAFVANSLVGDGKIDIANTGSNQATIGYDTTNKLQVNVSSSGTTTLTAAGSSPFFNLAGGNVGIGQASASAKLHVTATTEQLRLGYDGSNYSSLTVSSGGDLTIAPSGNDLAVTGNVDVSGSLTAGTADAFSVNSSGAIAAATGVTSSGTITFSGLTANRLVTTTTGGQLTTTITSANAAASFSDETGTGLVVFNNSPSFVDDITLGANGGASGSILVNGSTSGTITIQPQAAAGTYNFNLPTTAGTSGYVLTSGGGSAAAMTWTDPAALGVRWNAIAAPTGNLSLAHGANTTAFTFNSVTAATAFDLSSTSLTTGNILSLSSNGTAAATGQTGLNISLQGTNASSSQTTYGAQISNTHAGSGTNVGLSVSASGGTNNYAAVFPNGYVGVGTSTPTSLSDILVSPTAANNLFTVRSGTSTASNVSIRPFSSDFGGDLAFNRSWDGTNDNRSNASYPSFRWAYASTTTPPVLAMQYAAAGTNPISWSYGTVFDNTGKVGIGDTSPAALLTVGSGDLFQVNASGAIAAVVGITNTGALNTTVSSATALTVANTGSDYALQVDTSTSSSATGIKIKSAAAAGGVALSVISSGTDEKLTIDAKGAGNIEIGSTSTGDILLGGGSTTTGCTVTNSTGALGCRVGISSGVAGSSIGAFNLSGNTSGTVSILPQAAAGTYNFNLPITAGNSGEVLTSAGGVSSPMTWTAPGALAVRWSSLTAPTSALSLTMPATDETTFTIQSTTQTGFLWQSSTLTTGVLGKYLVSGTSAVATPASSGSALTVASTTTGFTAATQTVAAVNSSGANTNSGVTVQGFSSTVTNTNGTSGTNIAGVFSASGATTANYAIVVPQTGGNVGIGNSTPGRKLVVELDDSNNAGVANVMSVNHTTTGTAASGIGIGFLFGVENGSGTTVNSGSISSQLTTVTSTAEVGKTSLWAINGGSLAERLVVSGPGVLTLSGYSTNGGLLFTDGSGVVSQTGAGSTTQVLHGGTSPSYSAVSLVNDITGILTGTNGGTGVNNGSSTITLGGNLITSGAFATTLTSTATTNVTLPTSGTLATQAGTEALTNKTGFNGLVVTANTGVITTGTWQGGVIAGTYGGTGVNNGSSTITLGGNLITSGAFATTLTSTATTNVTLPTSGTLYGTATSSITSAQLLGSLTNETGSGVAVFDTNPTFSASAIFSGLTASSAVYTDGSKALTSTAPTSGTIGYWSRSSTTLQPATANDILSIPTTNTTGADLAITNTGVYTGTGIFNLTANSATTGTLASIASSGLTTGKLLDLQVSGTAAAASQTALNILTTGATATNAITTYGAQISNTHTNGTSGTNIGLYLNASGATTANYALVVPSGGGNIGLGTVSPTAMLHIVGVAPAVATGGNGTASTAPLTIVGGNGGASSYNTGAVQGGTAGVVNITGGNGGAITGSPATGIGGTGGVINLTAGDGGTGTTFGGVGGNITLAGGNGGFGVTNGSAGYVAIKGGNGFPSGNSSGADVFLVGGTANGSGTSGNIYLGTSPSFTSRGNVAIGFTSAPSYKLDVLNSATTQTASNRVANFSNTGATFNTTSGALSSYGGYFSSTSTRSSGANDLTNIGLYATASGAQNNYAAIFENGYVGIGNTTPLVPLHVTGDALISTGLRGGNLAIGAYSPWSSLSNELTGNGTDLVLQVTGGAKVGLNTTAPDKKLEINSATGDNLRLTYNDSNGSAANYVDLLTSSGGDLTITPSGGDTTITGSLTVSNLSSGSAKCVEANTSGTLTLAAAACGTGSGGTFDTIGDPAGNGAINMGTTTQTLDWGSTTTTDNLTVTSSATGLTSGSAFKVTAATTGAVTNGIVQLLSSGAYTGTGGLLNVTSSASTAGTLVNFTNNTASFTGNLQSITGNGITSGKALSIASSSTAFTGNLANITLSGSNAANTGALLQLDNTGTSNTNTAFILNHYATGTNNLALRVNDVSGDTSPFVIDGDGNVGIGLTAPTSIFTVQQSADNTSTTNPIAFDINSVGSAGELTASSGQQTFAQFAPVINQSSTAGYTALKLNVTETATGSGVNRLADLQVGGSSKLAIRNDGSLLLQNASNIVSPYGSLGAFQNHLVRSEAFDNASWVKTNVTAPSADSQTAPDGSTTAESLVSTSSGGDVCQWSGTAASSDTFTFSVWARSSSSTQNFDLRVDAGATSCATANNVTGTAVTHTATTSWQRFTVTQTFSGATGNVKVRIFPGTTGGTGTIYAWGAQLEKSSTANGYAYTTGGTLTNTNRGSTQESNFATTSGFTYGGRQIINLEGAISASSSTIGQLIRVNDNATGTDDTATVRALEVQSFSGSNINGTNTAIAAFGYTFGVHAETTAQANEAVSPAAVFADLNNGSAPTQGNAIRAYSDNLTSADLVSFYQETTAFTGNGLEMNFGNNSGSFSGNFLDLQVAGTTKAHVSSAGKAFFSLTANTNSERLCWDGSGGTNEEITDCAGSPGDLAENFATSDATIGAMDVVVSTGNATELIKDGGYTTKAKIAKSSGAYQNNIIGVVSTNPNEVYADDLFAASENPRPVALVGRVPVKVTSENGAIKPGDYLTSSATSPGKAMKATRPGMVIGQALSTYTGSGIAEVIVFVNPTYYDPTVIVDGSGNVKMQMGTAGTTLLAQTTNMAAYTIDQQGSGDILQLQQEGVDRFLVQNNGSVNINVEPIEDTELVLDVKTADTSLLTLDAKGTLTLTGVILVKDDSFAGSVATQDGGLAEIAFTYDVGTGKPVIQLTPEAQVPVFAQIVEFKKDKQNRYTGFVIKTFGLNGEAVSAIVNYNVTAKEDDYKTYGEVLGAIDQPVDQPTIIDDTPPVTPETPPSEVTSTPPTDSPTGNQTENSTSTQTNEQIPPVSTAE
jgi:hypothetical protein